MITKEIQVGKFEVSPEDKTLSIRLDTVIKEDGVELSRSHHRCSYAPGDIEQVVECLGEDAPEVVYLNLLWSNEVIAAYKEIQALKEL